MRTAAPARVGSLPQLPELTVSPWPALSALSAANPLSVSVAELPSYEEARLWCSARGGGAARCADAQPGGHDGGSDALPAGLLPAAVPGIQPRRPRHRGHRRAVESAALLHGRRRRRSVEDGERRGALGAAH